MSQIYVFPHLKKFEQNELTEENVDAMAFHYSKQIMHQLENHGIHMDQSFFRDFELAHESLKSALRRSIGKYHDLQEYVDEVYEERDEVDEDDSG